MPKEKKSLKYLFKSIAKDVLSRQTILQIFLFCSSMYLCTEHRCAINSKISFKFLKVPSADGLRVLCYLFIRSL